MSADGVLKNENGKRRYSKDDEQNDISAALEEGLHQLDMTSTRSPLLENWVWLLTLKLPTYQLTQLPNSYGERASLHCNENKILVIARTTA